MKKLPRDVSFYKKTPNFDEKSIPKALLNRHNTKSGTWGKIVILSGNLEYTILEPELEMVILSESSFGVVEPEVYHYVKPIDKVLFYVEFYK